MGFNRRKMDDERRAAEEEAAARRTLDPQVRVDAERLVSDWNEPQAKRMLLLFSPTIDAAISARHLDDEKAIAAAAKITITGLSSGAVSAMRTRSRPRMPL